MEEKNAGFPGESVVQNSRDSAFFKSVINTIFLNKKLVQVWLESELLLLASTTDQKQTQYEPSNR